MNQRKVKILEVLSTILFYIIAIGIIVGAIGAVFANKIVYSLVFAFKTFILIGFMFFLLNAPFNGAAQIAIYGVAVSILFAFAIMLVAYNKEKNLYLAKSPRVLLAVIGIAMIVASIIFFVIEDYNIENIVPVLTQDINSYFDSTMNIAKGLFSSYLLVYEFLAVFFLVAIVGIGAIISHKRPEDS